MCVIFSNVSFHMCSQIAFLNRCKVTIVACERFVNFHMSPQMAYLTRCKFTFVACVWFSQMWVFTFALKSPSIATIVACERFFKYLFSHVSSNRLLEQMQIHISCTCVIFSNVSFHICCQIAKVTIIADVRNFSIMIFKSPAWNMQCYISWYMLYSEMLVFRCLPKSPTWTYAKSH